MEAAMTAAEKIHLSGKDWFTEQEAATYCGLSLSQFRSEYRHHNIHPRRFGGKKLYSRADLYAAIAAAPEWQPSTSVAAPGISVGAKVASNSADPSARLRPVRLREYAPRRKPS